MHSIQLLFNLSPFLFIAFCIYLDLNRMYPVRDEKSVSDSISVIASIALFLATLPFIYLFFVPNRYEILLCFLLIEMQLLFQTAVGLGYWVKEYKKICFFDKLKRSLLQEWNLIARLPAFYVKSRVNPCLMDLMVQLALIDGHIDESEMSSLQNSAQKLKIDNLRSLIEDRSRFSRTELFESFHKTLHLLLLEKPSARQLAAVRDGIYHFSCVDHGLEENEKIILKEIKEKISAYLEGEKKEELFDLYLVIQNEEQKNKINKIEECKQNPYKLDRFYTKRYALKAAKKYREMKLPIFIVKRVG